MFDMDISKDISNQESASEDACRTEALKNGYSIEDADTCDNNNKNCKNCPWK